MGKEKLILLNKVFNGVVSEAGVNPDHIKTMEVEVAGTTIYLIENKTLVVKETPREIYNLVNGIAPVAVAPPKSLPRAMPAPPARIIPTGPLPETKRISLKLPAPPRMPPPPNKM